MTASDEHQLILEAKEGNHDAFRVLIERHMKHAYNVAYGFVNSHDDAEDLAQEAFVRVFRSIRTFRGDSEFGTWLYRIVVNLSLNRVRRKKSMPEPLVDEAVASPMEQNLDLRIHIERTLHELPTLQRAVVILRHINGLSTREVSSILQCSQGTVKTHLHRGLKKMKSKMSFLKDELA